MAKILVTTDYSEASEKALLYAIQVAEHLKLPLHILHCAYRYALPTHSTELPVEYLVDLKSEQEMALEKYVYKYQKELEGIQYSTRVMHGSLLDIIPLYIKSEKIHLLVMGTEGVNSMGDYFFGSRTKKMMQKVDCNVLVVPDEANFKPIKSIVYASDYNPSERVLLEELVDFANYFEASVTILNIRQGDASEAYDESLRVSFEKLYMSDPEIGQKINAEMSFEQKSNPNVTEGLIEYAEEHATDILAVYPQKYSFVDKLFHKSISASLTSYAEMPILILRGDIDGRE